MTPAPPSRVGCAWDGGRPRKGSSRTCSRTAEADLRTRPRGGAMIAAMVHEVAAAGFSDPGAYEAARPSYPPDAVAWFVEHLRIGPGRTVVDLAAGTGKLTRLLVPAGANLIAAEPVAGMRATFRALLPQVPIVATTAEHLAFRDESLAAVTVA